MNLPSKALVGSCMICPSFQQQFHHLETAMICGCPKSRYALLVHCVLEYHHRSHPKEHTKHFVLHLARVHICAPFVCITFEFYAIVCINSVLCSAMFWYSYCIAKKCVLKIVKKFVENCSDMSFNTKHNTCSVTPPSPCQHQLLARALQSPWGSHLLQSTTRIGHPCRANWHRHLDMDADRNSCKDIRIY